MATTSSAREAEGEVQEWEKQEEQEQEEAAAAGASVGEKAGASVGEEVAGASVGEEVAGASVGEKAGASVGEEVAGASVGEKAGASVGEKAAVAGASVGEEVAGASVGEEVAGASVGEKAGASVGEEVAGASVGEKAGASVGEKAAVAGASVGEKAEASVGEEVAEAGASVGEKAAVAGASVGEEALESPRARLPRRRKGRDEGPVEVKLELHLLQSRWALWFFKNDRSRAWQDNLHVVTKFDTVEDFWAVYSHIQLASKLSSGCDYALFKDGIEPMWEDPKNKRGGRWLVTLAKQQRHIELDRLWLETLLCLIGESFEEYSREVCGAVINIRTKTDKIAVWTREAENQTGVLHVGRVYKERLGLSTKTIIGYQAHADTATKSNTLAKNKFVV